MGTAIFICSLFLFIVIIIITFLVKPHTKTKPLLNKDVSKNNFVLFTLFSIIYPTILFIVTFYLAALFDDKVNYYYGGNAFNLENTWIFWVVFLFIIFFIEKKYLIKKRSKHFKNNVFRVLYYLSTVSTIVASSSYFLSINVQLFSRVGRSSQDGFLLYVFFIHCLLPAFFWIVYYVVIKNYDSYKSFLHKRQKTRISNSKFLKKQQAITEIKEAKELVDLGILSKEEYDELSKKLKPIILDNEP